MTILDRIVEQKWREVEQLPREEVSVATVRQALAARGGVRDFLGALGATDLTDPARRIRLIAEVKKASPSAGVIRPDFDPVSIARAYEQAGAACLSVLTDERFFQGSLAYLQAIRAAVTLPLLRKDFIVDARQILEAARAGADAILLIVAILDDNRLRRFRELAEGAGLAALVEVHDETELQQALDSGATLLGVNNRDLKAFTVDLATTERLAARLPAGALESGRLRLVAESGIHTPADLVRLSACGAGAVLVGESLMRQTNIAEAVRRLLGT